MRSASLHVNIIGKSNGVGLARDIDLLADALWASGHRVNVTLIDDGQAKRRRSPLAQFATRARLAWGGADAKVRTADIEHGIESFDDRGHSPIVPRCEKRLRRVETVDFVDFVDLVDVVD
jgi:hypothetical protein